MSSVSLVGMHKQAGSGWKRIVGRDGGMKQKKWRKAGRTKPMLDTFFFEFRK